ncbi:tRNA pseudouridine(38-40) synthase TruA [Labilibaculum sp.]|uniref:tRNA pseudouridine(38-40) synthase TruA n=1 Tax=Labilibaculum sp. TaxID=2060723 RepID=UPI002AA6259D|nr:tRNA pseudouridine(38-40) synthase TruA [Labilibaculum sp.]MBN2598480.1 tRNA pseudouridine(38-40) synthase TruA [Marinifilaceae bacterium]
MRYFFHIGYKGTEYRGWQRQKNVMSVQEVIEDKLSNLLKEKIVCIGCGRTDAGVHSSQYFFHINTDKIWNDHHLFVLNKILPSDISVYDVFEVDNNNHAQASASKRTYNYFIHTKKNPFLNEISTLYNITPDVDKMAKASSIITKYNDFRALCKSPDSHNHTRCNIFSVKFFTDASKTNFRLEISANRFLRGMIRILVHELIEVGTGQKSIDEFEEMIKNKTPQQFLNIAHPQGLYLSQVQYPFFKTEPTNDFCPLLKMNQWIVINNVPL